MLARKGSTYGWIFLVGRLPRLRSRVCRTGWRKKIRGVGGGKREGWGTYVHRRELVRFKKALCAAAVSKSKIRRLRGLDNHDFVHRRDGVSHPWIKLRICEPCYGLLMHSTKHETLRKGSEDWLLLSLEGHDWLRNPTCVDNSPSEAIARSNV